MSDRKGIGSTLKLLFGVIIVAIMSLYFFYNFTTTTEENVEALSSASLAFDSKTRLLNMHETSFIVPIEENPRLMTSISYGCEYGNKTEGFRYTSSKPVPVTHEVHDYLQQYFNETFYGNYYFYVECNDNARNEEEEKLLEIGRPPPQDAEDVLSSRAEIHLPRGNMTYAYLQRWQ